MHPKADILLNWELETIDYYFQNGLNYYMGLLQKEFTENPSQIIGERDYSIGSYKYFRRSVLYELNALIEQWLLTVLLILRTRLFLTASEKSNRLGFWVWYYKRH